MKHKAYKYRLYPNKSQRELLEKHFGATRFVYNHFLERKISYYKETKKTIGWTKLANELVQMKHAVEFAWLSEIGSQSLQQTIIDLDRAYTNFFRSNAAFPKFKSKKKSKRSFRCPEPKQILVDFENDRLTIPKFTQTKKHGDNRIKCKFHRMFDGEIRQCTVSVDRCKHYFVSILVEESSPLPTKPKARRETALGLDFGIKTFLTTSRNEKIDSPRPYRLSLDKLKQHQSELLNFPKDSTAYRSKGEQIAKLHHKIVQQRKDFLDKLSYKLTNDNQIETVCIEDLSIKDMQKNGFKASNRAISDLSWFAFVQMLQYKSDWSGKNLIKIGRFEPSSKTCNICGYVNHNLTLDMREWVCPTCNNVLDRDLNAALNIVDFAFSSMQFKKGRDYPIEAISFG